MNLCRRYDTVPFHVEGNCSANGRDGWDRRKRKARATRKADSVGQRVDNVMVIEDSQIVDAEASPSFVKVHLHGVIVHTDHQEHAVRVDMHVEVVDLLRDVGRSGRTGVEVESNKGEGALMLVAVRPDELALTEPHVRPEGERRGRAGHRVYPGATAVDVRQTDKPVEVGNLRRIVDIGERG